jgi:hypothetical protein
MFLYVTDWNFEARKLGRVNNLFNFMLLISGDI